MKIFVQRGYSTDIHLFKNGQPGSNPAEPLGTVTEVLVAHGEETAADYLDATAAAVGILQNNLTYDTDADEAASSQSLVEVTAELTTSKKWMRLRFKVAPTAQPGQTYCRVVYQDGVAANYTNLMFRVTVHESLTRLWLGNRRLTLYNDPSLAPNMRGRYARQVVVYAECRDAGGVTAYADLTGSTYIQYAPPASVTCSACGLVRANFATASVPAGPAQRQGAVQVSIGPKTPEPLPNTTAPAELPIYVRDGTPGTRKLLSRFHTGTATTDRARKLKLLILTQGFTMAAERKAWLDLVKDQLFNPANTPFDKLRESIDLWTAELPVDDPKDGITLKSPLDSQGRLVPTYPIKSLDNAPGRIYTTLQLLSFVGLPAATDATLTLAVARQRWKDKLAASAAPMRRFDPDQVTQALFDAWRQQIPAQYVYAKDTPLDYAKGTRDLLLSSSKKLTRGDWGLGSRNIYFPLVAEDDYSLRATIASLGSSFADVTGALWDPFSKDDLAAGFVCVVVNDHTHGAVTTPVLSKRIRNLYVAQTATFSIGTDDYYTPASTLPVTDVDLTTTILSSAQARLDAKQAVKSFVHEFGHSFGLGDEYGDGYLRDHGHAAALTRPAPNVPVDEDADIRPNVVTAEQLQTLGVAALRNTVATDASGNTLKDADGKPIIVIKGTLAHPEKLKRNWDRTELAATLLAAPQAGASATSFTLKVAADQNWRAKKGKTALLRKRVLSTVMIEPGELYEVVIKDAALDTTRKFYTLQVQGALPRNGANKLLIEANDVLYVPRYYPKDKPTDPLIKMRLIAAEVAKLLQTSDFKMTSDVTNYALATRDTAATQSPPAAFQQAMTNDILMQGQLVGAVRYAWQILGVYEGGAEYDSGAYRPSGQSKMRQHLDIADPNSPIQNASGVVTGYTMVPSTFNYACQYYIVNRVNPNILPLLDADYDTYAH